MKKQSLIMAVVALLVGVGAVAALTISSGMITFADFRAKNFDIKPSVPPDGSLIETLSESHFEIDESGNVTIPNLLVFGDPPVRGVSTDGRVEWAYGTVDVGAAGNWVDSHPIEDPTGAACAVINPYDNEFGGEVIFTSAVRYSTGMAYTMWPGSGSCTITQQSGNVASCKVEPYAGGAKITALGIDGNAATIPAGAKAEWRAGFTLLDFHRYSCGIMRDPSEDVSDVLAWKLASIDASRVPADQFFIFVTDENGDYFNEDAICTGCAPDGHYRGLQIAWFVWKDLDE